MADRRRGSRVALRTVAVGFREAPDKNQAALTWTSTHRRENRLAEEALMITGDGNWSISWPRSATRSSSRVYLFEVSDPDEIIRAPRNRCCAAWSRVGRFTSC